MFQEPFEKKQQFEEDEEEEEEEEEEETKEQEPGSKAFRGYEFDVQIDKLKPLAYDFPDLLLLLESTYKDVQSSYKENFELYKSFVHNYITIIQALDKRQRADPYRPRMNRNPQLGPLPIGKPSIHSLLKELALAKNSVATKRFLMDSYLFILARRDLWDALYMFTLGDYANMNVQISKRMFDKDDNIRKLYEAMLDPEIPLLPETMEVYRCTTSNANFDIVNFKSFTSYRLTSVTLDSSIKTCLASNDGTEVVKMMITPKFVPGLFIGFQNISHHVKEREILLCPGIRFQNTPVWTQPVPQETMRFDWPLNQLEVLHDFDNEEEWQNGETYRVYYKRYTASLVKVEEHVQQLLETLPDAMNGFSEFEAAIREKQTKEWIRQRVARVKVEVQTHQKQKRKLSQQQ